jgi:hypothetical protein
MAASIEHVIYRGGRFPKEIEDRRSEVRTVEISSEVDKIDDMAFFCFTGIVTLHLPSSITSIGNQVFVGCDNLETVHIPSTVTQIGDNVFLRCSNLKTIGLPPALQSIGKAVFKKCHKLHSVNIPKSCETIGPNAFEGCVSLQKIVLPESVKFVGTSAFEGCSNLVLTASETASLGHLGENAFAGITKVTFSCSNLKMASLKGPAAHTFGSTLPKPIVQVEVPERPLDLLKNFLHAETAEDVVLNYYKMKASLGLDTKAKGTMIERYRMLRNKVAPLCDGLCKGVDLFSKLDDKISSVETTSPDGLSVCVIGGGPVGIRCAIELALVGQEVSLIEQLAASEVSQRPGMPQCMKWPTDDLLNLGVVLPRTESVNRRPVSRAYSNPTYSSRPKNANMRRAQSNANPVQLRAGTVPTAALEVGLIRVALILGVNFLFGTSYIEAERLTVTPNQHGVKDRNKWLVNMDFSHGLKATMEEEDSGRGGVSKHDFFLTTFGIAVREGSPIEDIINSRCFRTLLSVNCHAIVGSSSKRGSCGGGNRGSVRMATTDSLAQARVLAKKALRDLSFITKGSP